MSSFKPLNFDREIALKEYPSSGDSKFKVPQMIRESFLDAERERVELEAKINNEASRLSQIEIKRIKEEAYKEGFEQGRKDSFEAVEGEREQMILANKEALIEVMQLLNDQKSHLFKENMNFFFDLIGEITKKLIGKYINYDQEALGRWLIDTCDELSKSEELTFHTTEKLKVILESSLNYLKSHRTNFPNIKIVVNQEKDQIIVESKKVDIVTNFNEQIDNVIRLIGYNDANT